MHSFSQIYLPRLQSYQNELFSALKSSSISIAAQDKLMASMPSSHTWNSGSATLDLPLPYTTPLHMETTW